MARDITASLSATPTPWRIVVGDDYYITADGYPSEFIGHFKGDDMGPYLALVGNRPKDLGEANAALIVKAVNNHDALVKALQLARARIEYLGAVCSNSKHFEANASEFLPAIDGALSCAGGLDK